MNAIIWGALFVWSPLFFFLNLLCKWEMKREGWTDEDMAELQRRMLGETEQQAAVEVMEAAE